MYEFAMGGPRPDKTVGLEGVPDVQGGARKRPIASRLVGEGFFLKFSAFELKLAVFSKTEILVTPSTKSATSFPNSFKTISYGLQ